MESVSSDYHKNQAPQHATNSNQSPQKQERNSYESPARSASPAKSVGSEPDAETL